MQCSIYQCLINIYKLIIYCENAYYRFHKNYMSEQVREPQQQTNNQVNQNRDEDNLLQLERSTKSIILKQNNQNQDNIPKYKNRQKLYNGLHEIYSRLTTQSTRGIYEILGTYSNYQMFDYPKFENEEQQLVKQAHVNQNASKQKQGNINESLGNKSQLQKFNQTAFFGIQNQSSKISLPVDISNNQQPAVVKMFFKIFKKNSEAFQQFTQAYKENNPATLTQFISLSKKVLQNVSQKSVQAVQQLTTKFKNMQISKIIRAESRIINKSPDKTKQHQQDNQFISNNLHMEQAKKFVDQLRNKITQKYFFDVTDRDQKIVDFVILAERCINLQVMTSCFAQIKRCKLRTPINQDYLKNRKDDRINSGISQRVSSAQSQRLKSALSKNSQNDDNSFNLDLTAKTRNSKNPFQIGKVDSLMYSAQSGFGLFHESPNKQLRTDNQSNHSGHKNFSDKIDQLQQKQLQQQKNKRNSLQKSYSQRVEVQKVDPKMKRMLTTKQRIQQAQQNDHENQFHDSKLQNLEREEQNQQNQKQNNNSFAAHQSQNNKDERQQQKREQKNKNNIMYKNRSSQNIESLSKKKKSKYRNNDDQQNQSSMNQDTIVNRVQNFDADDQQQNFHQKSLQQSAKFNHSNHIQSHKPNKKRVETQIHKQKKQRKKDQGNYSIKNIKRFNKVDFSKLQEGQSVADSQVKSNQNSSNNIFATQISNYHNKISKLRLQKQTKKKILERQLAKINQQLKVLNQKQQETSPNNKNNNYPSRVKISDNGQALKRAESLVKNLRSQKKNRNIAKIGQFTNIDKNINNYMEQLTKIRAQNQQKMKQKKKLQILQRMKQNQVRKINQKKKISQNQQFVLHLKGAVDSNNNLKLQSIKQPQIQSKRTPNKSQQQKLALPVIDNVASEVNHRKGYSHKVRSFSVKKQAYDLYDQALG